MEQCSVDDKADSPDRRLKMGQWRRLLGATLLLVLPSSLVMTAIWACQFQWLRGLWRAGGRGGQIAPSAAAAPEKKQLRQYVSKELIVPHEVIGRVIGRHGARVRQMEEDSGARIKFKDVPSNKDKVAVISGAAEAVDLAEEMLQKVITDKLKPEEDREIVTILVPSSAVGRLIGRQGANIRTLQRESGAVITLPKGSDWQEERECVVKGNKEQIARAVALVQESIQQSALTRKRQVLRRREELRNRHQPPQLTYETLPSTAEYFGCFVSAVDDDGRVWVQVVEGHDPTLLDGLVVDMTEDYSKVSGEDLQVSSVVEGMVVAAPLDGDGHWYRAVVTRADQEGSVTLLYLDFGDHAQVKQTQIRTLRLEYYELPVPAICCQVAGIQPIGAKWSEAAIEDLARLTLCALWRVVMVRVCQSGETPFIHIVDTTTNKDVDVAEQMVELGHAAWGTSGSDVTVNVEWECAGTECVGLAGTFSHWRRIPLKRQTDGRFQISLHLDKSKEYQCKFLVDGQWKHSEKLPTVCDGYGGFNNVISAQ